MKYKVGDFGYWWTVTKGNEDIENKIYKNNLNISFKNLKSLKGCPKEVQGYFYCDSNYLETLEFVPIKIHKDFNCSGNQLTELKDSPKEVQGSFDCSRNNLISLEGCPKEIRGTFYCSSNKLSSLKGSPSIIMDNFDCVNNNLISLEGCPIKIGGILYCSYNTNKHLQEEFNIRKENPNLSEPEILNKMFQITKDRNYLSKETNSLFM